MKRSARIALAIAGFSLASACGLDLSGVGDSSSSGTDGGGGGASADGSGGPGSSQDSSTNGNDGSADDDGATDSGPTTTSDSSVPDAGPHDSGIDAGDAGVLYRCPAGGTVTDCADCAGNPLFCEMCGTGPARDHVCVPKGSACKMMYTLPGYTWCPCQNGDASTCEIPQQECNTMVNGCVTCGENLTDGYACKNNTTCNENNAKCQ